MTTQQLTLFGPTQQAPTLRGLHPRSVAGFNARIELRRLSLDRYEYVRKQTIRMLTEERGFNGKTRDAILREANAAARDAARRVYLNAGYTPCTGLCEGEHLASPGYSVCPYCGDRQGNEL